MKLVFLLIMLIISPIFIQISFASDLTNEYGSYKIRCIHYLGDVYHNGTNSFTYEYPEITYHIINGSIADFHINTNELLTMLIIHSSNAVLTLNLPKTFLDEKLAPLMFGAQTDQHLVPFSVQENSTSHILLMNLPSGNYNLSIMVSGTPESIPANMKDCILVSKVPEFGSLTEMIIVISIIGVIVISTRFRFIPKV